MYLGNRARARYLLVGLPDDPGQGPELEAHDGQDNASVEGAAGRLHRWESTSGAASLGYASLSSCS